MADFETRAGRSVDETDERRETTMRTYETVTDSTATDKQGRKYDVYGSVRFRLSSAGGSSRKYGPCEVCRKPADEMYIQVRQDRESVLSPWVENDDLVGHRECLICARTAA